MSSTIYGAPASPESIQLESLSQSYLFSRVQKYISLRDGESAIFLAERLLAMLQQTLLATPLSDESSRSTLVCSIEAVTHLLARAAFDQQNSRLPMASKTTGPGQQAHVQSQAGGASYAYYLLKDQHQFTEENQFFFAQCCFDLSKYPECERVLLAFSQPNPSPLPAHLASALIPDVVLPGGAQGALLLGRCAARTGRPDLAQAWLHRCLALDPLCFSAWKELCALGTEQNDIRTGNIMRVDLEEFEASCGADGAVLATDAASGDSQQSSQLDPLLSTPASKLLQPMQVLSLRTPTPRQALFQTPFTATGFGSPLGAASTHHQQQHVPTSSQASSHHTPPRAGGAGRAGANVAGKRRPGPPGHARASSMNTPLSSTSASNVTTTRRKIPGKIHWESGSKGSSANLSSTTPSSSFASSFHTSSSQGGGGGHASTSEYSSDDGSSDRGGGAGGGLSEKERNEKKLVRRMARSNAADRTPGASTLAKTPRGPDSSGPTTPRRMAHGGSNSASASSTSAGGILASAKKGVNPTPMTARRAMNTGAAAQAAAQAPRKRLPEISESTPDSQLGSSQQSTPQFQGGGGGTNLLASLQTPAMATSTAGPNSTSSVSSRHLRTRSQPAVNFSSLLCAGGVDDSLVPLHGGDADDDAIMHDSDAGTGGEEDLPAMRSATEEQTEEDEDDTQAQNSRLKQQQYKNEIQSSATYLTTLLQTICEGIRLQSLYKCKLSISVLQSLPSHHVSTPLIQSTLGRVHFDMQDYRTSIAFYESLLQSSSSSSFTNSSSCTGGLTNLYGLDFLSTCYWHLGLSSELSSLALWCQEHDSLAPESWIVVGNVFSLQREHDLALKFFRRAIQCDRFQAAYASTLSAHEYMSNEDFERAIIGYRFSLTLDERFYNAWYGLGNLYLRQEKYSQAIYHFKRAIKIHPTSSVLHCYLGMTYHASKQHLLALQSFREADSLDGKNPLAKYHLAHVYLALGQEEDALKELQILKEIVPREANVHFLMGKIWKKRGKLNEAMFHFVTALDLDPKDRTQIKAAIEHLHSSSIDDEDASEI